jgi:ectoine hydroxylase-related dioxygenase (phytanoyl-CoA dioxygenase family)
MNSQRTFPRYGIKQQVPSGDAISRAVESLALVGYAVVDSGLGENQRTKLAERFDHVQQTVQAEQGRARLEAIDEQNTIRAPLSRDDLFLDLAQNSNVLRICKLVFGDSFVLSQQNGVINPPNARYNQGAYHRDLPYQHFVASRPIAINALYCIDAFTLENGATKLVPASHKVEAFPSDEVVSQLEISILAPAGSFLVLDCMTFHSGGANRTQTPRRAVNHIYSLPFVKQQINLQTLFEGRELPARTKKLFDFDNGAAADVSAYYERRRAKLAPAP